MVRGVIDLAEVTPDGRQRSELWRAMRGVGSQDLLRPLASAARLDPAPEVRAQAVATLALDFPQDPQGRAVLEAIARDDPSPLLRALAVRGLVGDQAWKEYVAASLRDTSRPATERIEALVFHVRGPSPPGTLSMAPWSVFGEIFGPDETAAFVEVYPDAFAGAPNEAKSTLITLMSSVAFNTGHPAVTAMVLDNLEHGANRMEWTMAAEGLLRRNDADPRVRAALEEIAAGSVDAQLRAAAERVLKTAAAPRAQ